jgi:cyclophilin family peptidyl-prolyl cis-trans isomerase
MTKCISMLCGFLLLFAFQANAPAQTITNQPQSLTVNNASTATFSVGASNALAYQWYFNGTNLSDVGNITGSTSPVLTLDDVTSNQAGIYTVVINGSMTSSNAVLTITNGTIVTFTFSGFIGGGTSNVDVQLFDHDKPATVQNFIHYIRSGAFTNNMFFQRCVPGFVLQGGSFGASNSTDMSPPITGWDVASTFTTATNQNPPFPQQVDSEFNVGPFIPNHFGTIAMALQSGEPDSATSGFFFNLADDSVPPNDLDTNTGGFTVFGRILDGTNVLQYFNTLTNGGIIANQVFLDNGSLYTNPFPALPVNYATTNAPANANLIFGDLQFQTTPPVDTNLPSVAITSPAPGALLTSGTLVPVEGEASDNVGLALVVGELAPVVAADGTSPNGGVTITNYASGTSNWSASFSYTEDYLGFFPETYPPPVGNYELSAQSQSGAGYFSPAASEMLSITAILANGNGTVAILQGAQGGFTNLNAVGYPFQEGSNYIVEAIPGTNQTFVNWSGDGYYTTQPDIAFAYQGFDFPYEGEVFTATFISNDVGGIAFTSPSNNALLSVTLSNISGTINTNVLTLPVTVSCQIFTNSVSNYAVIFPITTMTSTTNWSVSVTNFLPTGSYFIQALATDQNSNTTLISENFTVDYFGVLQLIVVGDGAVSPVTNGEILSIGTNFEVTATPAPGESFYAWNNGTQIFSDATQTFTMTSNLTLIAEFVSSNAPRAISFTYPPANAGLNTNSFLLRGRIVPSVKSAQVICQISSLSTGLEVGPPLMTSGTNTWSVAVTNLPPDDYEVQAVATFDGGKSAAISERFAVLDFKKITGTYSGLFLCANGPVASTNSGFITFPLGVSGAFSGKLLFPAYKPVSMHNIFFADGGIELTLFGFPENPMFIYLDLPLTNGSDTLTGYVYSTNANSWVSPILCYRAAKQLSDDTTPATGKYVLDLNPGDQTNRPETNGYASLSIGSSGVFSLSGALPDGAPFSQSATVSTNGVWPLYVIPTGYKTSGMLIGWETNQKSGVSSGQLHWYKAPNIGDYYTSGIDTNVNSTGTNYIPPAAGNYSIVFQGGTIGLPVTNALTVAHAGGQFKPVNPADKLTISLSASGMLTGHFVDPNDNETLQFKGAFFGQSQGGGGFILDSGGQPGYFLLTPQ